MFDDTAERKKKPDFTLQTFLSFFFRWFAYLIPRNQLIFDFVFSILFFGMTSTNQKKVKVLVETQPNNINDYW